MTEFRCLTVKIIGAGTAGPGLHTEKPQVTGGEGVHMWTCLFQGAGSITVLRRPRWRCASCCLAKDVQGDWSWPVPACHVVPVNHCCCLKGGLYSAPPAESKHEEGMRTELEGRKPQAKAAAWLTTDGPKQAQHLQHGPWQFPGTGA